MLGEKGLGRSVIVVRLLGPNLHTTPKTRSSHNERGGSESVTIPSFQKKRPHNGGFFITQDGERRGFQANLKKHDTPVNTRKDKEPQSS